MPQTIKPATPLPWAAESGALYQPNTERIYATDPGPELDFTVAFVRDADENTRKQNAAYIVHACNSYPRLVEALRGQRSILTMTLAAVDAAATGATLTSPDDYAANIRRDARKHLQSLDALLRELGGE